ncbi:MAG: adenylyltransferase/cytidyltransferase family protein [Patescibacteria group bacterium]
MKNHIEQKPSLVMAFGVFDLIHDGHKHFLSNAKKLGGKLVVVVAKDKTVLELKKSLPYNTLAQRIKNLRALEIADEIVYGDNEIGSWKIIHRKRPKIIALGYDQETLREELKKFIRQENLNIQCISITPHSNEKLHSSLLRSKL